MGGMRDVAAYQFQKGNALPDTGTSVTRITVPVGGAVDTGGRKSAHYGNRSEAQAAGVAPIRQGEPGYSSKLDRDNDGIACQ